MIWVPVVRAGQHARPSPCRWLWTAWHLGERRILDEAAAALDEPDNSYPPTSPAPNPPPP